MNTARLIRTTRPPFLLLSLFCCLLGTSIALGLNPQITALPVVLVFIAALSAHVAVNSLNEYEDFESGLDLLTHKTPFSGGSGALPEDPDVARRVLTLALSALVLTVVCGLGLIWIRGYELIWLGLPGVLLILTYTRWLNRFPWACLIAPGSGFGLIMVAGTVYALAGEIDELTIALSLMVFFQVNNLLLLNQYPDTSADQQVGRRHFPIHYGFDASNRAYLVFALAAFLPLVYLVTVLSYPFNLLLVLVLLVPGLFAYSGALRYRQALGDHPHYLAANVAVALLTPLLLAILLYLEPVNSLL